MAKFAIRVIEKLARTVIVENVNTLEEAVSVVERSVNEDRLVLDLDDFDEREIRPSDYLKNGVVSEGRDVSFYTHIDSNEILNSFENTNISM